MIRTLSISLLASLALAFGQAASYDIDKAHSVVGFSITHMTVSEVTGTFKDYTGTITW
ncbi:MAG: YceI family protein, partial [Spirochaetia bacterium]|nr:YceI family protein [Spirochaetia bacterium]